MNVELVLVRDNFLAGLFYARHMREFWDYWWRLFKLIAGSVAIPLVLYLLLLWAGVFK